MYTKYLKCINLMALVFAKLAIVKAHDFTITVSYSQKEILVSSNLSKKEPNILKDFYPSL